MAQSNAARQKSLDNQKKRLQAEIKQINGLLFKNSKKEKSVLSQVEDLSVKILRPKRFGKSQQRTRQSADPTDKCQPKKHY